MGDLGSFVEDMGATLRKEAVTAENAARFNTPSTMKLFAEDAARAADRAAAAKAAVPAESAAAKAATSAPTAIVVHDEPNTSVKNKIDNRRHSAVSSERAPLALEVGPPLSPP